MEEICSRELCTGCSACMNICPKDAITMAEQGICGYIYPSIDSNKCIDCGLCVKTCPINTPIELCTPLKAFAAISKDEKDLMSSSSGAASSLMANYILSNDGVVYGCVQENYKNISHKKIDTLENAYKIKNSKYVQSNIGLILREVKKDLHDGKEVLFIGTPCQIAGLRKYLRKEYENLYLVDLVCHGVPSQKLLQEDVEMILKANNIKNKDVKVLFRKKTEGKVKYGLYLFDNDNNEIELSKKYTEYLNNYYITGFLSEVILRENCFSCPYAQGNRGSDITIADFWGLHQCSIPQDKGVSLMLTSTNKGLQLIDKITPHTKIEERSVEEAIKGNGRLMSASKFPKQRNQFMKEYKNDSNIAYSNLIKYYRKVYKRKQFKIKAHMLLRSCKPVFKILHFFKKLIKK